MVKRQYEGEPIDQTWQDYEDRPYGGDGKTIAVTGDLVGEEKIDWLPSDLDAESLTETQLRILKTASIYPMTESAKVIAEKSGASRSTVKRVLRKYHDGHRAAKYRSTHNIPYEKRDYDDLTSRQQNIIDSYLDTGTIRGTVISIGSGKTSVQKCLRRHKHIIANRGGDVERLSVAEKRYADLTENQQEIVDTIVDDPDQSILSVADATNVSFPTVRKVVMKYDYILERRGVEPSRVSNQPQQKPPSEKEYNDLTTDQQEIVDYLIEYDPDTIKNAADALGAAYNTVYNIKDKYPHILEQMGIDVDSFTDSKQKTPESKRFDDLTDKQKRCVDVFASNPSATITKVANEAGVSRPTARRVKEKYWRFVEHRRSLQPGNDR